MKRKKRNLAGKHKEMKIRNVSVIRAAPLELKVEATRREETNEILGGGAFEDMSYPSSEMLLVDCKIQDEKLKVEEMKDDIVYLESIVDRRTPPPPPP